MFVRLGREYCMKGCRFMVSVWLVMVEGVVGFSSFFLFLLMFRCGGVFGVRGIMKNGGGRSIWCVVWGLVMLYRFVKFVNIFYGFNVMC